ncbi:MAG: sigma 54-interacting transcriptional regulator [bacterium]|jgi:Nif-specific regulatory protein|nr:sigma 54-interacting transcriptional regulator [bacterium]
MSAIPNLMTMAKQLLAESDLQRLLVLAMDQVVEISGAERGMIILFDENGKILFENARDLKREDIERPEFEISSTIINKVKTEGTPICLRNALDDPTLKKSDSVARLKILSVICLPLQHDQKTFGVVYLDNRSVRGVFKPETCNFLKEFSDFISLAAFNALERKRLKNGITALETELRGKYQFEAIISSHPKMMDILKLVSQVADTDAIVLIQGESGTGKELIARALHYNSRRCGKSFVPINCSALPENLLESELFGHVKGAYTGAIKEKAGWFECAEGGTIFLDEINDMSSALQARLLRIIQTGEFSRVGSTEIRKCNVRIVTATNKNLLAAVKQGKFRDDLYYRLDVINIELLPLRERKSDIPLLINHFLDAYNKKLGKNVQRLSREVETMLLSYDYPGNIRELENIIQRSVTLAETDIIELKHLPTHFTLCREVMQKKTKSINLTEIKRQAAQKAEQEILIECLRANRGHISKTARMLNVDVGNLHRIIKKYGIDPNSFKTS